MDQNNQQGAFPNFYGIPGLNGTTNQVMSPFQVLQMQNILSQLMTSQNNAINLDPQQQSIFSEQWAMFQSMNLVPGANYQVPNLMTGSEPSMSSSSTPLTQSASPITESQPSSSGNLLDKPIPSVSTEPSLDKPIPSVRTVRSMNTEMEYDEGTDDVDDMFGFSLEEEDEKRSASRSGSAEMEPVSFTPPHSPQLAFDDIFRMPPSNSPAQAMSAQVANPQVRGKKHKNIPIYRQKANLLSMEAESIKKKDPNYDVFEFQDDEFGSPELKESKKMTPKKIEPKYIPGVGFKVEEKPKKIDRWQPKFSLPLSVEGKKQEKPFLTLADQLRAQEDREMSNSFAKIEQSSSMECVKNAQRKVTIEQPRLPRFIIKVDGFEEEVLKRKNISGSGPEQKRYSLHKTTAEKCQPMSFRQGVNSEDRARLDLFSQADYSLPKGTFLVHNKGVLRDDCALYEINGPNLLRKFVQDTIHGMNKLIYRDTKMFASWNETVSTQYFRISVRFLKKSQALTVVEPVLPLAQLFSATSVECFKHPGSVVVQEPTFQPGQKYDLRQVPLATFLDACLKQVFTNSHVELLREKRDWRYLSAISEIDQINAQFEEMIKNRVRIDMTVHRCIGTYARLIVVESAYNSLTKCQVCNGQSPDKVLQFYDKTFCDMNLQVEILINEDPLMADAIACGRCAKAIEYLHKLHHLKLHMFRACRDKLQELGTIHTDLTASQLIGKLKDDQPWMQSRIQYYCDLWDQIQSQF